ncbi:MAG TPA: hypothetical protein PKW55_06270 [Spirochaetota bacterium]|nr:hypothetical protein [Spirochaetota bacterium]HOM38489.1 hypothetical protein [Spirochaetota bacterium]HPQ49029.1 hypothetical protein [Spirochaetota bacterium]
MPKKVFDSNLDSSIVGMNNDEKSQLRKKLLETQAKLSSKNVKQNIQPSKTYEKKVSLLKLIWNFILSLIAGIHFKKDANISVKRIREIKKYLTSMGINFYDFKTDSITSEFAIYIYEIFKGISIVYDIFINPHNKRNNYLFQKIFFDTIFPSDSRNLLRNLEKKSLEEVFYNENIKDKRKFLKEQQEKLTEFIKTNQNHLLKYINIFEQIINIHESVNFLIIFSKFGTYKNETFTVDNPKITSNELLESLYELGAAIKVLTEDRIPDETKNIIINTHRQVKESIECEDFIDLQLIEKSIILLRKLLKLNIIDSMIQYITMDETKISGFINPKKYILNKYLSEIINESNKNFNKLEDEKAKEFLIKSILEFFEIKSENELEQAGIYNKENKTFFESIEIENIMEYMKPLSIVLTFIKKYYDTFLREVINTLIVKGSFIKKIEGEEFSGNYYATDDAIQKLKDFIAKNLNTSDNDDRNLVIEIVKTKRNVSTVEKKIIREKFKSYDEQIREILDKFNENLFKIFEFLEKVKLDFKRKYPEVISNINVLSGIKGMSFYSALEKAVFLFDKYFDIIRNFMIIKTDFAKKIEEIEKLEGLKSK